jgi:hypothetical protein
MNKALYNQLIVLLTSRLLQNNIMLLTKIILGQTTILIPTLTIRVGEITQISVGNKMTCNPPKVIPTTKEINLIAKIKVIVTKGTVPSHMFKMPIKIQLAILNQNQTLN